MIRKAYVDVPEGQLHYLHAGPEGQPPLVFMHQNTSSAAMFVPTMERLADAYRVIAFDLPGFGGSFDPPERFTDIEYLGKAVMQGLDALGIHEAHLVGQHTGAGLAVQMAAHHPERIKSVVLIGPFQLTEDEKAGYRKTFAGSAAPDLDGRYLKATWDYLAELGATASVDLMHREFWEALRAWRVRDWIYKCVWDFDFQLWYGRIGCPSLLMSAEDDVLYAGYLRAAADHPEADRAVVNGANFEPSLDAEGVSGAIRSFLVKHGY